MHRLIAAIAGLVLLAPSGRATPVDSVPQVGQVLRHFCADCHLGGNREAGFALDALDPARMDGANATAWLRVGEQVKFSEMPPPGSPQPSGEQRRALLDWIIGSLRKSGANTATLEAPLTGNAVDHDLLFNSRDLQPLDNPPRLWRLSPQLYLAVVGRGSGTDPTSQAMNAAAGEGFRDVAGSATIDDGVLSVVMRNATKAAHSLTSRASFTPLLDSAREPLDQEIIQAIRFMLFYKRLEQLEEDEGARFVGLYRKVRGQSGPAAATRALVVAALLQPEMLFRMELGLGRVEADGRRMLSPVEIAYSLNAALCDTRADRARLTGEPLETPQAVAAAVDLMLARPLPANPRILRFLQEYFGYTAALDVFKDKALNPHFHAPALVSDTDKLVVRILEQDQDVLHRLLTTTETYAAARQQDKTTGEWTEIYPNEQAWRPYGIDSFPRQQPVHLSDDERAGILTQPSWLVAHSGNFNNDAVARGKWIRERLLGGHVPGVPITVDAKLSDDETLTLRERMHATTESYCWQCHRRMNPLGLPFEIYDHFGRFRKTETVVAAAATDEEEPSSPTATPRTTREVPLDPSGDITASGDPRLDGPVPDAVAMIRRLAGSERVRQVFVRHAFRYWMGREENLGDAQTLRDADRAYVESGGSMKALIKSLLTSDSFLYRTIPRESPER